MTRALETRPLEDRFDELEAALEFLLACFEAPAFPEPAAIDAAWIRVQRDFEALRADLEHAGAAHQESLTKCLRLYAVATGLLARRREELAGERSLCTRVQEHLHTLHDARGGDCDVRA